VATTTNEAPTDDKGIVTVGKLRLIGHDQAAHLLGVKPASLSTALSRGQIQLTRYPHGRGFRYDLAEVEKLILSRAVPAGRRVR
jgi:hypothetical protein